MSDIKETNYFIEEYNLSKGLDWYKSRFKGKAKIYGEASPHYSSYPHFKNVPERMHELVPNVKLIYLVRNPIDRFVSHYLDFYRHFEEDRSFYELMSDTNLKESIYVNRSKYYFQIEQFLEYFPKEKILALFSNDLKNNRESTLKEVFKFLGVKNYYDFSKTYALKNVSGWQYRRKKVKRWIRFLLLEDDGLNKYIPKNIKNKMEDFLLPKGELVTRPKLTDEYRKKLFSIFKEDIYCFENFVGKKCTELYL